MDERPTNYDRRGLLRSLAAGTVGVAGLAGCLGRDGGDDDNPFAAGTATDGDDDNRATTAGGDAGDLEIGVADGGTLDGHPAVRDLAGQPYFGPPPGTAAGTVVAFEDTSCSRCAAFEEGTVEKIRTELAAGGDATFVFRGYPILYPSTARPACAVLEATLDRSARAHFAMAREYFTNQNDYSPENVYDRSEQRLEELTDLDGTGVVADARDGAYDEAVATDVAAGEAAGASSTPAVYLFRAGEFRTMASGSLSFEAVRTTLGL